MAATDGAEPGSAPDLLIRPAAPDDLPAVAELFLASRAAAEPAMPPVLDAADARRFVEGCDLGERDVWLAEDPYDPDGAPVGFAMLHDAWLDMLYVAPGRGRAGVGTALLDLVKALRPGGFGLWVFVSNLPARAFYARHGLREVERTDGSENQERAPDIRLVWP